jgi:acetoin utilization deacetylase AcuC-like enzyme
MLKTGLVADPAVRQHDTGPGHPEQPARYSAVMDRLEFTGLRDLLTPIHPRAANEDEIALVHTRPYMALVAEEIGRTSPNCPGEQLSTGDTVVSPQSLDAALRATGCVLSAVDAVFSGQVNNAFCVVRPPGHHANAGRGMGFCVFNNVAVGARYAQQKFGAGRVAIVDWDVHHGNGTQDIFYEDGSVMFFSSHQSPWYPGTGAATETGQGQGAGLTINCPFGAGAGRAQLMQAFARSLLPKLAEFRPDLLMISAGFDSRVNDPLGQFTLTDEDFKDLTLLLLEAADKYAGGRIVSALEGGYSLSGLASASAAHVRALAQIH